jgi:hypothetical protein
MSFYGGANFPVSQDKKSGAGLLADIHQVLTIRC